VIDKEKALETSRAWKREHAAHVKAYNADWRKRNAARCRAYDKSRSKQKVRARAILRDWIYRGALKRKPCEVCGNTKSHGHHEDYSKPLEVRWLCQKHHEAIHHV
jgi:hypothetical protein